jgi:hypothetical protein
MDQQKFELEKEKMRLQAQIDTQKHNQQMEHAAAKHSQDMAHATTKVLLDSTKPNADGNEQQESPLVKLMPDFLEQLKHATAPKRIVRDHTGRAVGLEPLAH